MSEEFDSSQKCPILGGCGGRQLLELGKTGLWVLPFQYLSVQHFAAKWVSSTEYLISTLLSYYVIR